MCAKNKLNFTLAGLVSWLIVGSVSCTRKTTREVIGVPPVALETPTAPLSPPSQPDYGEGQESLPRFDGGRPESIAIPATEKPRQGRFSDVYAELSGTEALSCRESKL